MYYISEMGFLAAIITYKCVRAPLTECVCVYDDDENNGKSYQYDKLSIAPKTQKNKKKSNKRD